MEVGNPSYNNLVLSNSSLTLNYGDKKFGHFTRWSGGMEIELGNESTSPLTYVRGQATDYAQLNLLALSRSGTGGHSADIYLQAGEGSYAGLHEIRLVTFRSGTQNAGIQVDGSEGKIKWSGDIGLTNAFSNKSATTETAVTIDATSKGTVTATVDVPTGYTFCSVYKIDTNHPSILQMTT